MPTKRYAFFALSPEVAEEYYVNWFYVRDYQNVLALNKALYDIGDDTREFIEFTLLASTYNHEFTEQSDDEFGPPIIWNIDRYNIARLDEDDLKSIQDAVSDGFMYGGIGLGLDENIQQIAIYQLIDSMMCESLLALLKKGYFIFVRRYNEGTYEEPNIPSMKDRLLTYISIDTRVDNSTDDRPSNDGMTVLASLIVSALIDAGCITKTYVSDTYTVVATLESNTDKDIPKIGFTAHMDSHNYLGTEANFDPEVNKLLDDLYNSRGIDLYDKPYTQSELDKWYREGVIVSSNDTTGIGVKGKAGIVEILGMLEYLKAHPEVSHGDLVFLFTSDAELGKSMLNIETIDELEDTSIMFFVEGEGLNTVQYSNYNITRLIYTFTGINKSANSYVSATKNACLFVHELLYGSSAKDIGEITIERISGTSTRTELEIEIKDINNDTLTTRISYITKTLSDMSNLIPSNSVSCKTNRLYSNIQTRVPTSMVTLASEANKAVYNRTIINNILDTSYGDTANVSTLVSKGYPAIVLSNGVFNAYKSTECIPIPAMNSCRDVLINIIKLSSTLTFNDLN